MLIFDDATTSALNDAGSQLLWCELIKQALGTTKRVEVRRFTSIPTDWNTGWTAGTLIRDFDLIGEMSATTELSNFGIVSGMRTKVAANFTDGGFYFIRVFNAGRTLWMQGTYGLAASNPDFTRNTNPTGNATEGEAFTARVLAPSLLFSGFGDPAPAKTADVAHTVVIELRNGKGFGTGYTEAGRFSFDRRLKNYIYPDLRMAEERGDVGVYQSNDTIRITDLSENIDIEVGGTLFHSGAQNTEVGNVTLQDIVLHATCKNWPNYPFWAEESAPSVAVYDNKAITTYYPAMRGRILDANGTQIGWIRDLEDDSDINDPTHVQGVFYDPTTGQAANPVMTGPMAGPTHTFRPHVNVAQPLKWRNTAPRQSDVGRQIIPGAEPGVMRESMAVGRGASNPAFRQISDYNQRLGVNHLAFIPEWPRPQASQPRPALQNPHANPNVPQAGYNWYQTGWRYNYGAIGGHDWWTKHGGPRSIDRCLIPSSMMMAQGDPTSRRSEGGWFHSEMALNYFDNAFNVSLNFFTNAKTGASLDRERTILGQYSDGIGAYGAGPYQPGYAYGAPTPGQINKGPAQTRVNLRPNADKATGASPIGSNYTQDPEAHFQAYYDKQGRLPFHGTEADDNHTNDNVGLGSIMFCTPVYGWLQGIKCHANVMAWLNYTTPVSLPQSDFLYRTMTWRIETFAMGWMFAQNHELWWTREQFERRIRGEYQHYYNIGYKPAYVDNDMGFFGRCIRAFGEVPDTTTDGLADIANGALKGRTAFHSGYLGQLLLFLRHSKLEEKIRTWGPDFNTMCDFFPQCMDKMMGEYIADGNGRVRMTRTTNGAGREFVELGAGNPVQPSDVPTSWADWNTKYPVTSPLQDFVHDASGAHRRDEYFEGFDVGKHMCYQWVVTRNRYFPDIPHPKSIIAETKLRGWYQEVTDGVQAGTLNDWEFYYPGLAPFAEQPE